MNCFDFHHLFSVIVNDIKGVQKNRGDSDTKYLNRLVEQDEFMQVVVPEEVLLATRKKKGSPKKSNVSLESDLFDDEMVSGDGSSERMSDAGGDVASSSSSSSSELSNTGGGAITAAVDPALEPALAPLPPPRSKKTVSTKTTSTPAQPVMRRTDIRVRGRSKSVAQQEPTSPDSVTNNSVEPQ